MNADGPGLRSRPGNGELKIVLGAVWERGWGLLSNLFGLGGRLPLTLGAMRGAARCFQRPRGTEPCIDHASNLIKSNDLIPLAHLQRRNVDSHEHNGLLFLRSRYKDLLRAKG